MAASPHPRMSAPAPPVRPTAVLTGLGLWLVVVVTLGASGRLESLQPPVPQLTLVALTAGALLATATIPAVRAWALSVDVRILVGFHLTRFVGSYFLVLYGRGELPYAFAVPGGWGDILVASLALLLLISGPPETVQRRRAYVAWNVLGLLDILFVVATAARLGLAEPASMQALLRLPLSLLPTFLVPLIITSHVLLAVRLARAGQAVSVE
jgi:hypothetical protein